MTRTPLTLTGAGMRTKLWLNVYAVASYVDARATVSTPKALIATPHLKQLRLVFERDLSGSLMASSIVRALRATCPEGAFAKEVAQLEAYLKAKSIQRHQTVVLTHLPGRGLRCRVAKHPLLTIPGDAFARAVWRIYFGDAPLEKGLKQALSARLERPASRPAKRDVVPPR